jgi:ATP-dependent DNA ligase
LHSCGYRNVAERAPQGDAAAFDHPDWLFELKYDGFRALLEIDPAGARLLSSPVLLPYQYPPKKPRRLES